MRFLWAFLSTVALLVLMYVIALEVVDPRDEFSGHRFPPVFLDVRRDKIALFRSYDAESTVRAVMLGSSTTMTVPPETLDRATGLRFFNFGVHAGHMEDYLAFYRWTRMHQPAVRTVVLGLDQWALSGGPREAFFDDEWDLISQLEPQWRTPLGHLRHTIARYHHAFTVGYVRDIALSVRLRLRPETPIQILHADGSMHYERYNRQIAAGTYPRDEIISSCIDNQLGSQVDSTISRERAQYLESLFQEAASQRVRLVVYITPLHPRVTNTRLGERLRGGSLAAIRQRRCCAAQPRSGRGGRWFLTLMCSCSGSSRSSSLFSGSPARSAPAMCSSP
jgi:hypothetical protein